MISRHNATKCLDFLVVFSKIIDEKRKLLHVKKIFEYFFKN